MEAQPIPQKIVEYNYAPQDKQASLHRCYAHEIFYGGAKGGGKSVGIRHDGFDWCARVPGIEVYLFRRTYPELWDNHIKFALQEFPKDVCEYKKEHNIFQFKNGSIYHMAYAQHEKDVLKFQGRAINILLIDQVEQWTKWMFDQLVSCVRLHIDVPGEYKHLLPRIVCSGNPGDIGHAWNKSRWVKPGGKFIPMTIWQPEEEGAMTRCFIPAKLTDNPRMQETDPGYYNRLMALPPHLRKAYLEGDYDVFAGQVFDVLRQDIHRVKLGYLPETWELFRAMDWGHAQPFSYGLYAMDFNKRMYRIREWYGWNGNANEGLKMDPEEVADGIKEIESNLRDTQTIRPGPACPIMFNKTGGRSIAERMAARGITFIRGDIDPVNRLMETYTRLNYRLYPDKTPMLVTLEGNDKHFWRLMPEMIADDQRPEIVSKDQEDHLYEEVSLACMYRKMAPLKKEAIEQQLLDQEYPMLDPEAGI